MNRSMVVPALLQQLNVIWFEGAAVHLDKRFSREEFHDRYDRAFEGDEQTRVVLVIDNVGGIFIVKDCDQLWMNAYTLFGHHGIQMVLRIPREIWRKVLPILKPTEYICDLSRPKAA